MSQNEGRNVVSKSRGFTDDVGSAQLKVFWSLICFQGVRYRKLGLLIEPATGSSASQLSVLQEAQPVVSVVVVVVVQIIIVVQVVVKQ